MFRQIDTKFKEGIINKLDEKRVDTNLVQKAYDLAKALHRSQFRKDGQPYLVHPVDVSIILTDLGFDTDVICAGLLHDVVEDCGYTIEKISNEFNENIAKLVDAVSAIDKNDYIYNSNQIYEDINFVKSSVEEQTFNKLYSIGKNYPLAFSIKFADRLNNLKTISIFPKAKQLEKVKETEQWILPIAHILNAEYFYRAIQNECFKIKNQDNDFNFLYNYNEYHSTNKNNFNKLIIKLKETFASDTFCEILGHDILEYKVFKDISELIKIDNVKKISHGQVLKVSNYNIYFLHKKQTNANAVKIFINKVEQKLKGYVRIIDAKIGHFTKKTYFVFEDNFRNKYNVYIMAKNDYTKQMIGTLDGQLDKYIDEENTHNIATEYIKTKTRSNEVIYMAKGSTVLDFAFKIHKDIGLGFKYAIVNDSKSKLPPYTILNDGDKVEIFNVRDDKGLIINSAEIKWLAYVNTDLAKKVLIKYFENIIKSSNNE